MKRIALVCFGCLLLAGCGDPIYDFRGFESPPTDVVMTSGSDPSRYEWPYSKNGYVVAKPPPMAYVTSFDQPIPVPDPVSAELVAWPEDELDETANKILHDAFDPPETELTIARTLPVDTIAGPQAFDVSSDGERLVTVEAAGLGLYKMSDGSLIGHMQLPPDVGDTEITAVRFCGRSKDLLIASPEQIFRISGKDGSIAAQSKGCGAQIKRWVITADDTAMLMLADNGKIYGGDSKLGYFSVHNLGRNAMVDDADLSPDGKRIVAMVDGMLRTYYLDNLQIIDQNDLPGLTAETDQLSVSSGISTDGWTDARGLAYSFKNEDQARTWGAYEMLWRPYWISAATNNDDYNWFLTLGQRIRNGQREWILFELGPSSRNHSIGHVLAERPTSIRHSRRGHRLAVLDSTGLQICSRRVWQASDELFLATDVYQLVNEGKFDQIEKICDIVSKQTRLGYGLTPGKIVHDVVYEAGMRWKYLETNEPDSEILQGLQQWYRQGSHHALCASAVRHSKIAWEARGTGYVDSVSQAEWKIWEDRLTQCIADTDKALAQQQTPSLAALSYRISAGLNTEADLEDVDELCRQATELYPENFTTPYNLCVKLLPQWHGEPGDAISFALSHSRAIASPGAELLYARLVGSISLYVHSQDRVGWKSYDSNRVMRGLEEWMRRDMHTFQNFWLLHSRHRFELRDQQGADRLLRYAMAKQAAVPYRFTHGDHRHQYQGIVDAIKRISAESE